MRDWFTWNGVRCTQYGIHVSEQPPITLAAERVETITIPGRSGTLTSVDGIDVFDEMTLTAQCFIVDESQIRAIAAWLRGGGDVTFANRPYGHYKGRIANQIQFEQVMRGRTNKNFAVNFRVQPYLYIDGVEDIDITESGAAITNPGNVHSEPCITVYGSGDITLMIGMDIVELTDVNGSITIDSEMQETYTEDAMANNKMSGDYPKLLAGLNGISWVGNVTKITIKPRWRER